MLCSYENLKEDEKRLFIMCTRKLIDIEVLEEAIMHTLWDLYHCWIRTSF